MIRDRKQSSHLVWASLMKVFHSLDRQLLAESADNILSMSGVVRVMNLYRKSARALG